MESATPDRSRQAPWLFRLFPAVLAGGTIWMGAVYAHTDGGAWINDRFGRLASQGAAASVAFSAAALLGAAANLGLCARRRLTAATAALAAGAAFMLLALGWRSGMGPALAGAPDWLRITVAMIAGAGWGAGWFLAQRLARSSPPLWGFGIPFVLAAAVEALRSGSYGAPVALLWSLVLATAMGRVCLRHLPCCRTASDEPVPLLVEFATGIAALGLLGLGLGLVHGAYPAAILAALLLLSLLLWRSIGTAMRAALRWLREPEALSPGAAVLLGTLAAVLLAQWTACLAPETGPDALGGRIALPAMWLRDGVLAARPEILASSMGLAGESLFLLFLPVSGYNIAKVLAFACLLVAFTFIWARPRRRLDAWSIGTALVFSTSTIVWWQFIHGFVDLLQALLVLGAAECLRRWLNRENDRDALAAGLLAGAAAAVKLNAAIAIVAVCAVVFATTFSRRRSLRAAIVTALRPGGAAVLMIAPWILRTTLLTGNPLFPFANRLFLSPLASPDVVAKHYGLPLGPGALAAAYKVFLTPGLFVELGTYHPFLLPLMAALVLMLPLANRSTRYWFLAFAVAAVFWLISDQNLRYSLFAGLLALPMIVQATASIVGDRPTAGARLSTGLLAIGAGAGAMLVLARPSAWMWSVNDNADLPLRWACGLTSTDDYLRSQLPTYPLATVLNRTSGRAARLWQMPWVRDHLYFNCPVVSMPHGDIRMLRPLLALLPGRGEALEPAGIDARLRAAGITHLLFSVENPWIDGQPESAWPGIFSPAFTETWLQPLAASNGLRLYAVRSTPGSPGAGEEPVGRVPIAASTHRDFAVNSDHLYWIRCRPLPLGSADDHFIDMSWFDASGTMLRFQRTAVPAGSSGSWHSWLESPPPAAVRVRLYVNFTAVGSDLQVTSIHNDHDTR